MATLIYENKVPSAYRADFIAKVIKVAANLKINPNWLMIVMDHETGGRFSPSLWNPNKKYVGLVQFGALAAKDMKTTLTALSRMTAVQQLDYVEKYYKTWYRYIKISTVSALEDFYLITLFPSAVNKGRNAVIGSKSIPPKKFARSNHTFNTNKDGVVTVGEVRNALLKKLPSEWVSSIA